VALPRRQQREGEKGATVGRGGFYNGTTGWGTGRGLHHAAMRGGGPARQSGGAAWPAAARPRRSWVAHARGATKQGRAGADRWAPLQSSSVAV
jgi:hypothetical protein